MKTHTEIENKEKELPEGFSEYTLPAVWASYLINGDASGLEDTDIDQCDRDTKYLGACVGMGDDEWFEPYKGIGHTVAKFTFRDKE